MWLQTHVEYSFKGLEYGSVDKLWGQFPVLPTLGMLVYTCNPSPWKVERRGQKLKVVLHPIASLKPSCTWDPVLKPNQKANTSTGSLGGDRLKSFYGFVLV